MSVPLCPLSKHGLQTRRQQKSSLNLKGLFNSTRSSSVFWHESSSAEQLRSHGRVVFTQHFWVKWKHVSRRSLFFFKFNFFCLRCLLVQCVNCKGIHFISRLPKVSRSQVFTPHVGLKRGHKNPSSARFYIPAKTDALFYRLQKNKSFPTIWVWWISFRAVSLISIM